MKNFIVILTLLFSLAPLPALADAGGAGQGVIENSCQDTLCKCYLSNEFKTDVPGINNEVECRQACIPAVAAWNQNFEDPEQTTSAFYCDGQMIEYKEGKVYQYGVATGSAKSPVIPILNVPIPGLDFSNAVYTDEDGNMRSNVLGAYIDAIYNYLLGAATVIALTFLMIGGVQYALARGDAGMVTKAKDRIKNAITGLILLLLAYNIAFLIDPRTVNLEPLAIKGVPSDGFPPEGEDVNIVPNANLTGVGRKVDMTYMVNYTQGDIYLDDEAATALENAAKMYREKSGGKSIVVNAGSRSLEFQAQMFYNNCLTNGKKVCYPTTCNIAINSPVLGGGWLGPYSLIGELEGETDAATIIKTLAANGKYGNCPHTSAVAVDVWGDTAKGAWTYSPKYQQLLTTVMIENGWCRLGSEPWHFELDSKKVSKSSCSTSNNTVMYTNRKGTFNPNVATCAAWDFYNNKCVAEVPATQ